MGKSQTIAATQKSISVPQYIKIIDQQIEFAKKMKVTESEKKHGASDRLPPLCIEGGPGIGKSEIPEQRAEHHKVPYAQLSALTVNTPGDIAGALKIEDGVTKNAPREEFQRLMKLKSNEAGVLVIDDAKRLHVQILNELMDFLRLGKIGSDMFLPKNVVMILTNNPTSGMFHGNKFDVAQSTRVLNFKSLEPDIIQWLAWASRSGIHDMVVSYLAEFPDRLYDSATYALNPRMWQIISAAMDVHSEDLWLPIMRNNLPENDPFIDYVSSAKDGQITIMNIRTMLQSGGVDSVIKVIEDAHGKRDIGEKHRLMRLVSVVGSRIGLQPKDVSKLLMANCVGIDIARVYIHFWSQTDIWGAIQTDKDLRDFVYKETQEI